MMKLEWGVDDFQFSIFKILKFENEKRFPGKTPYTLPQKIEKAEDKDFQSADEYWIDLIVNAISLKTNTLSTLAI